MDLEKLKAKYQAKNDTVDVEAIVVSYVEAEDGYDYLSTLSTKELIAVRAYLHTNHGIDTDYINSGTKHTRVVYLVNKALKTLLS